MGPIDNFFKRAGFNIPERKKTFWEKYGNTIIFLGVIAVILGLVYAYVTIFGIPIFLSK